MSGISRDGWRFYKLPIVSGLESALGNRWCGINREVNFLVEEAVFVPDDQPSFGVIFCD